MVDVAAIFDEVFGPGDQGQGLPEKKCVLRVSVSGHPKPLEGLDNSNTKTDDTKHIFEKNVSENGDKCVRDIVENQGVTGSKHKNTKTHSIMGTLSKPVELDAFEERAAIIHDAHTITFTNDGTSLAEPIFALTQEQAETLVAREQGHADADSLHGDVVGRWAAEIERLATLPAVSPEGGEALKRTQAFLADGWALQAARLGWGEVELFGVCPRAPWHRLDRKGAAFGGAVQAVTQEAVTYIGGLRRYRATVNNDGGAVLLWELAQDNPSNGGQP